MAYIVISNRQWLKYQNMIRLELRAPKSRGLEGQGYVGYVNLINTNTEDCCGERRWWQTAAWVLSSK